ncbi:Formin-like protein 14 [Camellia lanceoleosa]|uniref:Formin-like protein 14 n=1 Tax=Camellia lanceoleosa TaxID=1840588 RepID=A0ACC0GC41_9ERIC|nr:Formin-like protein 14 [Camellia lanceoleosa]
MNASPAVDFFYGEVVRFRFLWLKNPKPEQHSRNEESANLCQVMPRILTIGNALNQGSAIGFKLNSLLKLSDTRARNNKMTLMHWQPQELDLCPGVGIQCFLSLPRRCQSCWILIRISFIWEQPLKSLAEEMQAVSKGLEKVEQELTASENDGAISAGFQKGRSADSLSRYFGN